MSTTSTEHYTEVAAWEAGRIAEHVEKLAKRIERNNLNGSISMEISNHRVATLTASDGSKYDAPAVDIELTYSNDAIVIGEYRIIGVADFTGTDEPLIFSVDDDDPIVDEMDSKRCDHCERRVERNKIIVVADADGNHVHVGSTCVKDFLGHDPLSTLFVSTRTSFGFPDKVDRTMPTVMFIAAAAVAIKTWGWARTGDNAPTRDAATAIVNGRLTKDEHSKIDDATAGFDSIAVATAAIEWAESIEARNEFEFNMNKIARSEWIGPKAFGIAAYITEAHARHLGKVAEWKVKADAEADRKADAEPVVEGRAVIKGTVVKEYIKDGHYGETHKMTLITDRGWKLNGSVPKAIESTYNWENDETIEGVKIGDVVEFTATVKIPDFASDTIDALYSRPTKASITAVAA